jgi:hypothetical protein
VEIPVSPDEFDFWLKETGQPCHLELLWAFAEAKAELLSRTADTSND